MSYTKLFQTILTSSVWQEDDKTRLVWITLLALKNKNGEVAASVPGLAHMAGVSIDDTIKALEKLSSTDSWSRTKDYEGRRIEEIPGGWIVLNSDKYRLLESSEEVKVQAAARQARYRERHKKDEALRSVTPPLRAVTSDGKSRHTDANADSVSFLSNAGALNDANPDLLLEFEASDSEPIPKPSGQSDDLPSGPNGKNKTRLPAGFEEFWAVYPKRQGKIDAIAVWTKKMKEKTFPPLDVLIDHVKRRSQTEDWTKDNGKYILQPAKFLRGNRWTDDITPIGPPPRPVLSREEQARRMAMHLQRLEEQHELPMKQS